MNPKYVEGTSVRVRGQFRTHDGDLTDPSGVFFHFREPGADEITEYESGVDAELVNEGDFEGTYHVDLDTADKPGLWKWLFGATGAQVVRGEFYIERDEI